jgi:hypothetical protein
MRNDAKKPYPYGDDVDPNLDGQIIKFKVSINPLNIKDVNLTK